MIKRKSIGFFLWSFFPSLRLHLILWMGESQRIDPKCRALVFLLASGGTDKVFGLQRTRHRGRLPGESLDEGHW